MYHGLCMVPIADMFNHSDQANIHFEADDEVCDECGSLGSCPHNNDPLPSEAYGRPSSIIKAESGPNSEGWEPPMELRGIDTVDMVAQEDIDSRQQLFSTYGNFTNSNLLVTYGFGLEWATEWERYVWEWRNQEERRDLLLSWSHHENPFQAKFGERKDLSHQKQTWIANCARFASLPESSLDELQLDESASFMPLKQQDPAKLSLPISSPFVALTKPLNIPSEDSAQDLAESLEDHICELSTHDESKDMYQPLFVDQRGRISLALWRAAVMYNYSNWITQYPSLAFEDLDLLIYITEIRLHEALTDGIPQTITDEDNDWIWIILHDVLALFKQIIIRRKEQIEHLRGVVMGRHADESPQYMLPLIFKIYTDLPRYSHIKRRPLYKPARSGWASVASGSQRSEILRRSDDASVANLEKRPGRSPETCHKMKRLQQRKYLTSAREKNKVRSN
ncbi:hypothetical protein CBS101457_002449 [Exobasidium rhododendri]|nr:hypothetical protein CBS101457_002449 [Exobasidium rhododendri]